MPDSPNPNTGPARSLWAGSPLPRVCAVLGAAQLATLAAVALGTEVPVRELWPALVLGGVVLSGSVFWSWRQLRPLTAVRDAMRAAAGGELALEALRVGEQFGTLANAWNTWLHERQDLRESLASARAELELQSEEQVPEALGAVFSVLPQGVVLVGDTGLILFANGAAGRLLQSSAEALVGRPLEALSAETSVIQAVEAVVSGRDSRGRSLDVELHEAPEDETLPTPAADTVIRFTVRPLTGGQRGAVVVLEDVTQHAVAERSRHTFLAHATHELRTPLTNVGLYIERMIDLEDSETVERARCLNVMNEEVARLERVVQEVLSVSEMEAGAMSVDHDDVRLDSLMAAVEADFKPQAERKHITLRFDLPPKLPVLRGDREKVTLAVQNVLGNAIKYTENGGSVTVTAENDESRARITVEDTGIGIAPEQQARVFEKFSRAEDERVASITGSGLGLALAREVVRLHGGDITLESELNQGSRFVIELPVPAGAV